MNKILVTLLTAVLLFDVGITLAQTTANKKISSADSIEIPLEKSNPVTIARFEKPPIIDGNLDDEVWKQAVVLKDFYQTRPGDNIAPTHQTEVMLGYDAKFLYMAFHAFDDPQKVRATIAKRDSIQDDDNVRIILDTYNDQRRGYVFIFNPLGIQQDGIFTEGADSEDFSVDLVHESKGKITADGYTVEVAIPFKSLRYEAGKGKLWGIHLFRFIKHENNEQDSWMPIFRDKSGFYNQEGHLMGLEGISTERTLELIPSLTVSENGKRLRTIPFSALNNNPALLDRGRFLNQPIGFEPGLTAKFGITPTVTLDFALNPDFAQVESDQTVLTANQRFPIFFDEKRSFFLEGKDIFQTPLQAVHTRTIIDPDVAVKLSGKIGKNSFGILTASDNAPGNFSSEEREELNFNYEQCLKDNPNDFSNCTDPRRFYGKNSTVGIIRFKRDIGKENNLGFILTDYSFIEKHNLLGGFDGRFRLDPQTVFSFQVLGTNSRRYFYDADLDKNIYRTGNALAYFASIEKQKRHFNVNLTAKGVSKDYRADLGFTNRTNTNIVRLITFYNSEPKQKSILISYTLGNIANVQYDWKGRMQYAYLYPGLFFKFKQQAYLNLYAFLDYERLFEEEFGAKRTPTRQGAFAGADNERSTYYKGFNIATGIKPSKKYSLDFYVGRTWDSFDLDFGAGAKFPRVSPAALIDPNAPLDPGAGNSLNWGITAAYQPTDSLRLSLEYKKSILVRNDTKRTAFDSNIVSFNSSYQFSRFTFARARIDYDSIAANFRGQFLAGWTPNPGTAFYVGYNDNLNYRGFSPFTGQFEPSLQRNGRTFFIKMAYLFRHSF